MTKLILLVMVVIVAGLTAGCNSMTGDAPGGAHPAVENTGVGVKPPSIAGGGAKGSKTGGPSKTVGAQ